MDDCRSWNHARGDEKHDGDAAEREGDRPVRKAREGLLYPARRGDGEAAKGIDGDACDKRDDRPGEEHERERHQDAAAL